MALSAALAVSKQYGTQLIRDVDAIAEDLESFAQLLAKWSRVQNLVSRETLSDLWVRHIADSLQVLKFLSPADRHILDLGSGGGFPALPLAIALKGGGTQFLLVEPNGRKASFLKTVARELALPVRVEARRSDELDPRETSAIDVITSRALAPLETLCAMSKPFWQANTRAIFHKGREHMGELADSAAVWNHDVLILPSDTDASGVLIELKNLRLKSDS
jgi:16S rRNA (guanine527-N7)-methyltransferase